MKLRLRYSKTGRAKYISHLDLMATMRRAFLRAGLELKYSEGFNPHPYISVALPLPVGCASVCELMDFELADARRADDIPALVSSVLPEGLEVLEAYVPERKFSGISWAELCGKLFYDAGTSSCTAKRLKERFAAESIVVSKKTKSGMADIDIAPFIRDVDFHSGSVITMKVRISAQNPSISPSMLISSLDFDGVSIAPDFAAFTRMEVFDSDMNIFK